MSTMTQAAPSQIQITSETLPSQDMPNWQLQRIMKLRHEAIARKSEQARVGSEAIAEGSGDPTTYFLRVVDEIESELAVASTALRMITAKRYSPKPGEAGSGTTRVTYLPE